MSPLMQNIYEYISRSYIWYYMDHEEHTHLTACLTRLEEKLKTSLGEKDKRDFQCCLDMLMELNGMETEAMFQAAFVAARELS